MSKQMSDSPVKEAIEALYKPIEGIVKTVAGPAAEEIGLTFRDSVQVWRLKRQARLFARVKHVCNEAGIKPQAVKLPFLFDVFEQATLEGDDELQYLWANLLSNAADPGYKGLISTGFPDILKQLSKDEAKFLEDVQEQRRMPTKEEMRDEEAMERRRTAPEPSISPVYEENLRRLGLTVEISHLEFVHFPRSMYSNFFAQGRPLPQRTWTLTALGTAFINACKAPRQG